MANNRDNNADLGNQTIEGTLPPDAEATGFTMPQDDSPIIMGVPPEVDAQDLDAQLEALMAEPVETPYNGPTDAEAAATDGDGPIVIEPVIMTEPVITPEEPVITPEPEQAVTGDDAATIADLDAQLNAMLADEPAKSEPAPTPEVDAAALDAQLEALMADPVEQPTEQKAEQQAEQPIEQPAEQPQYQAQETQYQTQTEPVQPQQPYVQPQQEYAQPQQQYMPPQQQGYAQPQGYAQQQPQQSTNSEAEAARAMMQQAQMLMEQARAAQQQAEQARMQAEYARPQQVIIPQTADHNGTATEAARAMIQQAQMMMQQAQQAQMQAAMQQHNTSASPYPITDPYAAKEVDRLKAELDGMRDLVNKLTFSIAQQNGALPHMPQQPQFVPVNSAEHDQYRKLETELDKMRREIVEKDLRDREKELDRRQKEAESSVKDIRPEMVQMSESRDIAPVANQAPVGGEFIPLANGVFYSTRDKQVYVMTPASNAAAASPTIEPNRPVVKKRPAARRAPARRPRRPGGLHRRPMGPRRPPHR